MTTNPPTISTIEVGKPYLSNGRLRPAGAEYNFRGGAHELVVCLPDLTSEEIESVRRKPAEFALVREPPALVFFYRFGDQLPWSDCTYSWWLVPAGQRIAPWIPAESQRALLTTILIEQRTGLVRVLRATTFSPEFTGPLHVAIEEQANTPWIGREAFQRFVTDLYSRFPTTDSLLQLAAIRCRGGE